MTCSVETGGDEIVAERPSPRGSHGRWIAQSHRRPFEIGASRSRTLGRAHPIGLGRQHQLQIRFASTLFKRLFTLVHLPRNNPLNYFIFLLVHASRLPLAVLNTFLSFYILIRPLLTSNYKLFIFKSTLIVLQLHNTTFLTQAVSRQ